MTDKAWIQRIRPQLTRRRTIAFAAPALVLAAASCVPAGLLQSGAARQAAAAPVAVPPDVVDQSGVAAVTGEQALAANASLPFAGSSLAALPFAIHGRTALDGLRSLNCLAQTIYYEAGNESEDGQRAVAQVVLNRVRHPAWPNTVCGVVYQGPMRAGGGCQFTFTCDGSLMRRPGGLPWLRARRLAAEALGGATFAPVGLSTHYHANYVFPAWAPRLAKTTAIGAHIFYRLPGQWGERGAFTAAYAGREPLPRPAMTMVRPAFVPAFAGIPAAGALPVGTAPAPRASTAAPRIEPETVEAALPQPQVREEYRNSGQWRADSPIAPPRPAISAPSAR